MNVAGLVNRRRPGQPSRVKARAAPWRPVASGFAVDVKFVQGTIERRVAGPSNGDGAPLDVDQLVHVERRVAGRTVTLNVTAKN